MPQEPNSYDPALMELIPPPQEEVARQTEQYQAHISAGAAVPQFDEDQARLWGKRLGVDLDVTSGVPKGVRWKLGLARDTPTRIAILESEYGTGNVIEAGDGQLVVRNLIDADTGKKKDVRVNEVGFGLSDVAELATTAAPAMAGAALGILGRKRLIAPQREILRRLSDIVAGSVGANTVGAVEDAAVRLAYDQPVDFGEITSERSKMMVQDAVVDLGLTGIGSFIHKLPARAIAPFGGKRPPLQDTGLAAAKRLEAEAGVEIPFTPGEATGSKMLQRAETFATTVGSSRALEQLKARRTEAIGKIKQFMLGNRPLPSSQDVGERAVQSLQDMLTARKRDAAEVSLEAQKAATEGIQQVFDTESAGVRGMYASAVGKNIRTRVMGELDQGKALNRSQYDAYYKTPGGNARVYPTEALQGVADDVEKNLPSRTDIITDLSQALDSAGKPMVMVREGRKVIREFVPAKLMGMIEAVRKADARMPLNELVQMRNILSDAIDDASALPDIGTRYLKQFRHGVTQAIEDGKAELTKGPPKLRVAFRTADGKVHVSNKPMHATAAEDFPPDVASEGLRGFALPDGSWVGMGDVDNVMDAYTNGPQLVGALEKANTDYKKFRERFEQPGIPPLLRPSNAPGYVFDEDIVNEVVGGKGSATLLSNYKKFLGADSPEFGQLKRSALDRIARTASVGALDDGIVDGKKLATTLLGLEPEVLDTLLGKNAGPVLRSAQALGVFQGKINLKEFEGIVASGKNASKMFTGAIQKQRELDALYQNNVIRKFTAGETSAASLEPGEFVQRFALEADAPRVAEVMGMLSNADPQLAEDVRAKMLEHLFHRLDTATKPENLQNLQRTGRVGTLAEELDPKKLKQSVFADERVEAQYTAVLGHDRMRQLNDVGNVLAIDVQKDMVGQSVGGLGASSVFSALVSNLDVRAASKIAQYKLIARILASDRLRKYVSLRLPRPDSTALSQALIVAAPAITGAADEFKTESGLARYLGLLHEGFWGQADDQQQQTDQNSTPGVDPAVEQLMRQAQP
jgi:hypothetical protein